VTGSPGWERVPVFFLFFQVQARRDPCSGSDCETRSKFIFRFAMACLGLSRRTEATGTCGWDGVPVFFLFLQVAYVRLAR
jgi:hypothetical protein